MAVLPHEGTYPIMYGAFGVPIGVGFRSSYLSRPDRSGRFPVVIVLPDMAGLDAHEKDLCRHLARQGFGAVALSLYRPEGDPLAAYHDLDDQQVLVDLDETLEFLRSDQVAWAIPEPLGLLGLDLGGRLALIAAAHRRYVGSVAVAYAPLTGDEDRRYSVATMLTHLGVPVLGLYGTADELISSDTVDEAQRRNPTGQWLLYEGAGHDFLNASSPNYAAGAASDALARIAAFFAATLPAPEPVELG